VIVPEAQQPPTGNTKSTRPENRVFYPALDGLRAVAFLMVFFWHYLHLPWGWAGVDIFFILSGFLITGILFDTRDDPHRARKFYIRRMLRIFPLYYGVLLCLVLAWPWAHWPSSWLWIAWPLYLGNFLQLLRTNPFSTAGQVSSFFVATQWHGRAIAFSMGHFWSLCVEEQFYLVWPWLLFWIRDRRRLQIFCLCAIAGCLVLRLLAFHTLPTWMLLQEVVAHLTFFRMDDLLAGGLIALTVRGPYCDRMFRIARMLTPIALPVAIVWAVERSFAQRWVFYPYPATTETWGFSLLMVLGSLLIAVAIQPQTWLARMLKVRPLRWAGRLSYGAYVFHEIFHGVYTRIAQGLPHTEAILLRTSLALVATYALAWLSFRFFETPFLNLKERWAGST
jgi:peptidoglycan/LPS O-acetylase OafA/YrhL